MRNSLILLMLFSFAPGALCAVAAAGRAVLFTSDGEDDGTCQNSSQNCDEDEIYRSHTKPPVTASMITLNNRLTIHARMHCQRTTAAAHFQPSSRFTDAIAATQGV